MKYEVMIMSTHRDYVAYEGISEAEGPCQAAQNMLATLKIKELMPPTSKRIEVREFKTDKVYQFEYQILAPEFSLKWTNRGAPGLENG